MRQVEAEQLVLFETGPDIEELRREASMLRLQTRAKSTHKAYNSDWRGFEAWCASTGRTSLPASNDTLELYVVAELRAKRKISSVERYVAAIAARHRAANQPVPDRAGVRLILQGARRRRKESPKQRTALTPEVLRSICDRLVREGTPEAIRDRAIITLGFATALRRSNLAALDLRDIRFADPRGVAVTAQFSKTDQDGKGQTIGVFRGEHAGTCPVRSLKAWLDLRGDRPGPLFTSVRRGEVGKRRMGAERINGQLKRWIKSIGLNADEYGAHSLRAGFVTAAHCAGASALAIIERTGHKSIEMVKLYQRNVDPFAGPNPLAHAL